MLVTIANLRLMNASVGPVCTTALVWICSITTHVCAAQATRAITVRSTSMTALGILASMEALVRMGWMILPAFALQVRIIFSSFFFFLNVKMYSETEPLQYTKCLVLDPRVLCDMFEDDMSMSRV